MRVFGFNPQSKYKLTYHEINHKKSPASQQGL